MEIVEVGCPRSIDLISLPGIKEKYNHAKSVLETVDIYDYLIIKQEIKKSTGILITSKEKISDNLKENIKQILLLFSNYVGMFIHDLIIEINFDDIKLFKTDESILAGFIIALNLFFKTQLTIHELILIAEKINPLVSYYIVGGYKKINDVGNSYVIGKNPYDKYILLDKQFNDNKEEERLKNYLLENNLNYGVDNIYFIAMKKIITPSIPISIKRDFSNTIIHTVNNVSEQKIILKYLK